ncbi:MAG: YceI family protein [Gemmatimonadales bacterium]
MSSTTWWSRVRGSVPALVVMMVAGSRGAVGQVPMPIPSGVVVAGVLSFDGHATLGDFTGTTSAVRGAVHGATSINRVTGWVEAPVRSLVTGNGKRDRDLNGSMESDRFPVIRYELSGVATRDVRGDTVDVTLRGAFIIHGVRRPTEISGTLVFSGGAEEVAGETSLDLDDFAIKGLSKMLGLLKMHPGIEVHLDVTFGPLPPDPLPAPASDTTHP